MKNRTTNGYLRAMAVAVVVCLLQGCGGSMGTDDPDGPMLPTRVAVTTVQRPLEEGGTVMASHSQAVPADSEA